MREQYKPDKPGHYWYLPVGGNVDDDWIVLKVIQFEEREMWTSVEGYGKKVSGLEGRWLEGSLEDSRGLHYFYQTLKMSDESPAELEANVEQLFEDMGGEFKGKELNDWFNKHTNATGSGPVKPPPSLVSVDSKNVKLGK